MKHLLQEHAVQKDANLPQPILRTPRRISRRRPTSLSTLRSATDGPDSGSRAQPLSVSRKAPARATPRSAPVVALARSLDDPKHPGRLFYLMTSGTSLPRAPLYLEHLSTSSTSISTNQHKSAQISTNSAALAQGEIDLDSHRRPQDRRQERISQASPGPSPNTGIMSLMECRGGAPRVGYAKDRLMSIRPKHRDHRGPPISSSASSPSKQQKPGGDSRKASKCPVSASRRSTGHFGSVNPILLVRVRLPALRRDAPDSRTPAGLCGRASPVDLERMSPP